MSGRAICFTVLSVFGLCLILLSFPPPATAATYHIGQAADVKQANGKWYRAKIMRSKAGGEYLVDLNLLPKKFSRWVKENEMRAAGSGEVVDVKLFIAMEMLKKKFGALDGYLKQNRWGNSRWESSVPNYVKPIEKALKDIEKEWPKKDTKPMWAGLDRFKKKIAKQLGPADPGISDADAQTMADYYKKVADCAKAFPAQAIPENLIRAAEAMEKLPFAEIEARMAADKLKVPSLFKYYGMEEKGRYGDLPYGGQRAPKFARKSLENINRYYLKTIFQVRGSILKGEADLARTVTIAIKKAGNIELAGEALRVAKALKVLWPRIQGIDSKIKEAELLLENMKKEKAAVDKAKADAEAANRLQADKPKAVPKLNLAAINSGVKLVFSKDGAADAPGVESFEAGDFLYVHARFKASVLDAVDGYFSNEYLYLVIHFDEGEKELGYSSAGIRKVHLNAEDLGKGKGYVVLPVVSNADKDCFVYSNNLFNRTSWEIFAKLAPGKHKIRVRLSSSSPKVEGVPLAVGSFTINITPAGVAQWKANSAKVFTALLQRGGEKVIRGICIEGPNWKMIAGGKSIRSSYKVGNWKDKDFWIGLFKAGTRWSDHYQPEGGGSAICTSLGDGGWELKRSGKLLAKFDYQGNITDRNGKHWGKITNELDKIQHHSDLLKVVPGLLHFSDLLK